MRCQVFYVAMMLIDVDFQHHIWKLTLGGALATAPAHKTAKRVLDMGTGTGIWACEYGWCFLFQRLTTVHLLMKMPSGRISIYRGMYATLMEKLFGLCWDL